MRISTYQLFRNDFLIIYDSGNIRYRKFVNKLTMLKIIIGSLQVVFHNLIQKIIKR
jgi:hypothetical protein